MLLTHAEWLTELGLHETFYIVLGIVGKVK